MSKHIYIKRGSRNYKENQLIKQIQEAIDKNPSLKNEIKAANSFDELKQLHNKYCIETVAFTDVKTEATTTVSEETTSNTNTQTMEEENNGVQFENQDQNQIDPFNRAEPIVRSYVKEDPLNPEGKNLDSGTPNLGEPKTFEEAFKLPGDDEEKGETKTSSGGGGKKPPTTSINPAFDDMSGARKNKQTKRFAKYITEAVCTLLEHGIVWWTTKDINDTMLASYELNNEMDLSLLVSLDGVQEITCKQFFQIKCREAQENAVVSKDDREELADALADVLMEKGIAPTPTQTLIIVALKIVADKGIQAMKNKMETSAILGQLREMSKPKKRRANDIMDHINTTDGNNNPANNTEETVTAKAAENTDEGDDNEYDATHMPDDNNEQGLIKTS